MIEEIGEKVTAYVADKGEGPRYILLDNKSHKEFIKAWEPIEKINTSSSKKSGIFVLYIQSYELKVLKVDTKDRLVEVVG